MCRFNTPWKLLPEASYPLCSAVFGTCCCTLAMVSMQRGMQLRKSIQRPWVVDKASDAARIALYCDNIGFATADSYHAFRGHTHPSTAFSTKGFFDHSVLPPKQN